MSELINGDSQREPCVECGRLYEKYPFNGPLCDRCYRKLKPFTAYDLVLFAMLVTLFIIVAIIVWKGGVPL